MSEPGIERRFRSVTDGTQPEAPETLRRFLYELPDAPKARRRARDPFWVRLFRGVPVRGLAFGGVATVAIVVALVITGLALSLRNHATVGSSSATATTSAAPTARSTPQNTFRVAGLNWYGTTTPAGQPLPASAVRMPDGRFLGVASADRGRLVSSPDGLTWTDATSTLKDTGITLYSIAQGDGRYVLAGGADGTNGTDPLVYVSADGATWTRVPWSQDLDGAPMRQVIHGSDGFVGLGWNDGDAKAPVHVWWSSDGETWIYESDTSKLILGDGKATLGLSSVGYLLSGTITGAALNDGPEHVWALGSLDGKSWQLGYETSDVEMASPGASVFGSIRSSALMPGDVFTLGVFGRKDATGSTTLLKTREGAAWYAEDSFVDGEAAPAFDRLVRVGDTLLATAADGADIYFLDTAATEAANATARPAGSPPVRGVLIWQRIRVNAVTPGPRGTTAIAAGDAAIVYGTGSEQTGLWVALP